MTTDDTRLEGPNKYGVPKWLIEAMKSYDGLMSANVSKFKDPKMKAKRELAASFATELQRICGEVIPEPKKYIPNGSTEFNASNEYRKSGYNQAIDDMRYRLATELEKIRGQG